jgi:hypothetical protein
MVMLRRYLARRKMRWAVREAASKGPLARAWAARTSQERRLYRLADRILLPRGPIHIGFDFLDRRGSEK